MASIYAEYIGATNPQIAFTKVPNDQIVPFHFILAFATDLGGDGNFTPNWATQFDPSTILAYKKSHKETKFILSIGWYDDKYPFMGKGGNTWADNASKSIETIVDQYNLDGIDIYYSKIAATVTPATFSRDVGDLITKLKHNRVIQVASITPTPALDGYYKKLYDDHKDIIDFVNYRFYDLPKSPASVLEFKKDIAAVLEKYSGANLLAGNKTNDNSKGKITDQVFFKAYQQESSEFHGIFGWSADESPSSFQFENEAQKLLAKSS